MKTSRHGWLGLALVALGVLYLVGRPPGGPGWLWGLLGGGLFLLLARRGAPAEAAGLGSLLIGWALGALAADATGLQSLKLVGAGLGLGLWGGLERRELAAWGGGALLAAGALVFFWESPGGLFVALALLAFGAYLLLRPPAAPAPAAPRRADATVFRALARWRSLRAAELGTVNTEVLTDAELGCLAALSDPQNPELVAGCLEKGGAERAAEIARVLAQVRE
ncbi:HRDC domain protein [Oceanithermus profundus DSM 14977]|uniref:HRDC domain protein n=1 Tax=Oceanithermus profundus (strain DSM 14977 / NBRC 100410 / VKM B-2274 / 506) TaxID=670487 RepID=E4U528_OCEP5|nr:hypothetical protein [Oceanithermus profundus]ADR37440.1 HRDC domain protein [Oceanithermus profundus DSM 14977]